MRIGSYISELLDDHDLVVFPGLGAFTVQEKSAQLDEKTGVLKPPARQILFNEEVKVNDGILLNHFAHAEGIPAPKAHQEIANLCEDILYRLDHGETVELENLGKLSRISGKYNFEELEELKKYPGAFGLDPVKVIHFKEKPGNDAAQPAAETATVAEGLKVRRKNIYWLAIFPILVIAGFFYWMFSNRSPQNLPDRQKQEIAGEQQIMPVPVEPTPEETTEHDFSEANEVSPLLDEHPRKGLYYLIGGSFRTRENADQYFEQVSKKGFDPVYLGEIKNFHVVAIEYFSNEREAVSQQNRLLNKDSASGVWIYFIPESD